MTLELKAAWRSESRGNEIEPHTDDARNAVFGCAAAPLTPVLLTVFINYICIFYRNAVNTTQRRDRR